MKRTRRLSLLLLALVMSVLVAPEAFGGKPGGGVKKGGGSKANAAAAEYCDYYIYCNDGRDACCYGGLFDCWDACEWYCGGPCVYYGT